MKFAATLSYVLVALVASSAAANHGNVNRQKGGFGGFGGGNANNNANNGNNNNNSKAAASSTVAAASSTVAAASSTVAAAASSSVAAAAGAGSGNEQDSTTLDPSVIATGFAQDGQATPAAGQVASLTSTNNFINFCLTVNKPITNGQQIQAGSCNPAPMGVIAATTNMPSSKFVFPPNGGSVVEGQAFTIQMAISNIETGNFVNADSNYYSAPQQVNSAGDIIGHSHVVIEALSSLDQTTTTTPSTFAFFKGINGAAVNGVVTADVTDGLPAGVYRMASINAAANHQPVLVAVAQHGSLDDMVYFTVTSNSTGAAAASGAAATDVASATSSVAAKASSTAAASGKGGAKGKGFGFRFARDLNLD